MSDASERAKHYLVMASVAIEALEAIRQVSASVIGKGAAATAEEVLEALRGIQTLGTAIAQGFDGIVSVDTVHAAIKPLVDQIAQNNAKFRATLDKRFPPAV